PNACRAFRRALRIAPGSRPHPRIASPMLSPCSSVSASTSAGAMRPAIARLPQKLDAKRLDSFSQLANTSRVRRGLPMLPASHLMAQPAITTPSAPSYAPPCLTESVCEPLKTTLGLSPCRRPNLLPTASARTARPLSESHRSEEHTSELQSR